MIRTVPGNIPDHAPSPDHGVPHADQPRTIRRPAVSHRARPWRRLRPGAAPARSPKSRMTGFAPLARSPRSADQDQMNQSARTRRTIRADQSGKALDHVNRAGRRSPDQPPRRQPVTSMPPRSPPTAPASGKASRCPSASWQHHSVRPHGGGRATGWPKPSRNQSPVNRECTGRHPRQTTPTSEQCVGTVTRHVHLHLNSRRSSVTRHAQSTRRLRRPFADVGMLAVRASCHRHPSRGMVGPTLVTDGGNSAETWRARSA